MDEETAKIVGTRLLNVISDGMRRGKSRAEVEEEAIKALRRGDVVSDEVDERIQAYVQKSRSFEENG